MGVNCSRRNLSLLAIDINAFDAYQCEVEHQFESRFVVECQPTYVKMLGKTVFMIIRAGSSTSNESDVTYHDGHQAFIIETSCVWR